MNRLVRHFHMQRVFVRIRIDGNSADTHLARGLDDPAGNLTPVGDQDLVEHGTSFVLVFWERKNAAAGRKPHNGVMRDGGRGNGCPAMFLLAAVLLRLAVEHVSCGPDCGSEYRICVENGRTDRTGAATKQRLLAGCVSAGRNARTGGQYKDKS